MATGFRVFEAFRSVGVGPVEVYPHACFQTLRGARLPSKRSAAGIRARVDALGSRGIRDASLEMWSHDGLDAIVAAVVARDHAHDRAMKVTCGHDDSAIWLPAASAAV
jgi:predicted nuclease with RNAse H fold